MIAGVLLVLCHLGRAEAAECSGLKKAAAEAGLSVQGTKWVTVPKGHDWRRALPLYNDLKDYDVELLPLHCRQLARLIKAKVTELVTKNGVLLRVRLTGDAYRVADQLTLLLDDQPVKTSLDETDPGQPYSPGRHEVSVEVPNLRREEKLLVKPTLNGAPVSVGGGGDRFSFDLPATADGATQDLAVNISLVRRCIFTLRVNNETEQDPSKRAVLVLHGASEMPLPSGAVRVQGGRHALEVELEEDTRVDVAIDGQQLIPTDDPDAGDRNLRYVVPLECPKGQDQGRASLVVSLPRAELQNGAQAGSNDGLPTLFWVGAGTAAAGLFVSGISYFGYQSPAEERGNDLYADNGCADVTCDPDVVRRVNDAFDESDSARVWTVTGLVVGGVGAAVAVGALIFDASSTRHESEVVHLQPGIAPGNYSLNVVGRF